MAIEHTCCLHWRDNIEVCCLCGRPNRYSVEEEIKRLQEFLDGDT